MSETQAESKSRVDSFIDDYKRTLAELLEDFGMGNVKVAEHKEPKGLLVTIHKDLYDHRYEYFTLLPDDFLEMANKPVIESRLLFIGRKADVEFSRIFVGFTKREGDGLPTMTV